MIAATHGILEQGRGVVYPFANLGTPELVWDFTAPLAASATPGHNVVSAITNKFTYGFDFSGKGRHYGPGAANDSNGLIYTGGWAQGAGAQYSARVTDASVIIRTAIFLVKASVTALNVIASTSYGPGAAAGTFIGFNEASGAISGEKLTYYNGDTANNFVAITNTMPTDFFTAAVTTPTPGAMGLWVNGVEGTYAVQGVNSSTTLKNTLDFCLGKRLGINQYFTGEIKKVALFSSLLNSSEMAQAHNILTA